MMRSMHAGRRVAALLISVLGASAAAAAVAATPPSGFSQAAGAAAASQQSQQFVDGIAAVVNRQVITLKQVNTEVAEAQRNLQAQKIPVPEHSILQRQVLQRMIVEELQRQEADRLG